MLDSYANGFDWVGSRDTEQGLLRDLRRIQMGELQECGNAPALGYIVVPSLRWLLASRPFSPPLTTSSLLLAAAQLWLLFFFFCSLMNL